MPTNSAKGLRSDMIPRPPKEMLMRRKRESLRDDLLRVVAGLGVARLPGCKWVDRVAGGPRKRRPLLENEKEKDQDRAGENLSQMEVIKTSQHRQRLPTHSFQSHVTHLQPKICD